MNAAPSRVIPSVGGQRRTDRPLPMETELSGVLIVDKPEDFTSHDVVARVRRILAIRQIGHFGTLDPFATGVLPLSVGKATRFAQFYLKSRKSYEGVIRFGFATDTYDSTGIPTARSDADPPSAAALETTLQEFTGLIRQTPPPFSAKRVGGVRAYQLARQRQEVKLSPVEVEIYALEITGRFEGGREASFAVECSGGTYMRSLAHDIGIRVGCPAHLARLRRIAVAEFRQDRAVTLAELEGLAARSGVREAMIPLEDLLPECPELIVRGREEADVRHGHSFELRQSLRADRGGRPGSAPPLSVLKIMNGERRLIAIARHVSGNVYHPDLVVA